MDRKTSLTSDELRIIYVPLGQVVRAWRLHRNLSYGKLVEKGGTPLSKGYLSQLECNKIRQPGSKHMEALTKGLEIDPTILLARIFPGQEQFVGELDNKELYFLEQVSYELTLLLNDLERMRVQVQTTLQKVYYLQQIYLVNFTYQDDILDSTEQ